MVSSGSRGEEEGTGYGPTMPKGVSPMDSRGTFFQSGLSIIRKNERVNNLSNIKNLRLEKSSPQKEADHIKNHAPSY